MSRKKKPVILARESMKSLGVYKPEFEPIIHIYGELCEQYSELTERFVASAYDFSEDTIQGTKKAPIVTTLESLRKDILSYAAQLGLTPQGILKTDASAFAHKETGKLAMALAELKKEAGG